MMHFTAILRWIMAIGLAVVALTGRPAQADTGPESILISAGTLSETVGAITITGVTLTGVDQVTTYTIPITVNDLTGSGSGWNVQITSTQFTTGGGSPHTLPTTASVIQSVSSACGSSSTCTLPTNAISYPLTIPAAATAPTAVKMASGAAATGLGRVVLTTSVQLTIPANAYAGTYTSTITLTIASAP